MNRKQLVELYLNSINKGSQSFTPFTEASRVIDKCFADGWTYKQVKRAIETKHPKATSIRDILFPKENLVQNDQIFYHSELRIFPPMPKSRIDDEGNIIYINLDEEFSLEMTKTFCMYNLMKYYYSKFNIIPNTHEVKRDVGAMKYLLKFQSVDQLLFLIDVSWSIIIDADSAMPLTPLDMQSYTREANWAYEEKIAYDRSVGVIGREN